MSMPLLIVPSSQNEWAYLDTFYVEPSLYIFFVKLKINAPPLVNMIFTHVSPLIYAINKYMYCNEFKIIFP